MLHAIFEKYKNLSKPVKASLWFVVSNVLLKGISFITLPIFSRLLTTSEYGVVSVYASWVSLFSIVTTLTLWGDVFEVELARNPDVKVLSSFQGLSISLTCGFLLVSSLFIDQISAWLGMPRFLIYCMYLDILAQIPYSFWITKKRCNYEYKSVIVITVLVAVLNPILGIIAVKGFALGAEGRIISGLLLNCVIGIGTFWANQKESRTFFHKAYWRYSFGASIVLLPHYLSRQVLNQSDRVMIDRMCSSSDAGIYSVAYNFAMLLLLVTNGIHSSLTPNIYRKLSNKDTQSLGTQISGVTLFVAVMTLGLICVIPDVFKWMLPESYYEALWVIPPLVCGAYFMFLYPLFVSIEFFYEENRSVTTASVAGAIINVILNYIGIKLFGFIAAAYTTLVCYILFSLFHCAFMKYTLKKNSIQMKIYDIKALTAISVAVIVGSLGIVPLYELVVVRWSIILFIIIVAVIYRNKLVSLIKNIR